MSVDKEMTRTKPEAVDSELAADEETDRTSRIVVAIFILTPLAALLLALPLALADVLPLTWLDLGVGIGFYAITALGITVGYHRLFTHGAFKSNRAVRWWFAITGGMALQGKLRDWVADHRAHHAFSDKVGDPHSPWRFGTSHRDVAKGLWYAHMGWLLDPDMERDPKRYAPDILKDEVCSKTDRFYVLPVVATLLLPGIITGLITWSWMGALSGFFWAGLVRIALVHQVTWSINSVTHVWGRKPFRSRDESRNVAWLAIPSFGESWHNYHHADQTSARHGVLARQIDLSALTIRTMEKLGWAHDARWPSEDRVRSKLKPTAEYPRNAGIEVHRSLRTAEASPTTPDASRN